LVRAHPWRIAVPLRTRGGHLTMLPRLRWPPRLRPHLRWAGGKRTGDDDDATSTTEEFRNERRRGGMKSQRLRGGRLRRWCARPTMTVIGSSQFQSSLSSSSSTRIESRSLPSAFLPRSQSVLGAQVRVGGRCSIPPSLSSSSDKEIGGGRIAS
jgi:hypothetical protein